jgi:deazaflavin-dependent oxidoreductase (nitroreductase family)
MTDEDERVPKFNPSDDDIRGWNDGILEEFRANHGKSSRPTTTPITYFIDGERFLLVASNFGRDQHPAWYHNVVNTPEVTLEIGTELIRGRAIVTEGPERDRLFAFVSAIVPGYTEYQKVTDRIIPVVAIVRAGS